MKIGRDLNTQLDRKQPQKRVVPSTSQGFQSLVGQEREKLQDQALQKALKDIEDQGEKLAKFRSFKDLAKYKRMVRAFIEETIQHGLALEKSRSWDIEGGNRQLSLVKQIDEKLVQLTDDMLDHEKEALDLLKIIGEIKGLLVNLYV